jgi:hypothetical protein
MTTELPRILAIMGSGETAPTMAKVHRELLGRLGPRPVPAALLDSPYGFQENADEITARALEYFRVNVGYPMEVAALRANDDEPDPLVQATALARARDAQYLFSGPGSPSFALRQWHSSELTAIIAEKLAHGGVVTFASAAALTLGAWTIPVYEIYKVGAAPFWLEGLDVLGAMGMRVAVVPHYDNAEGGTHDTRFAYIGERRLAALESELPTDAWILGVDSHTALILDYAAGSATVQGLGCVTTRMRGRSRVYESGTTVAIEELARAASAGLAPVATATILPASAAGPGPAREPLLDEVRQQERRFDRAVVDGHTEDAIRTVLEMEDALVAWSRDTGGTDEVDRARAILQSLIVRLGDGAASANERPRLEPLVELLVELRARAREDRDFELGDRIRDTLMRVGIDVHDSPAGTTWERRSATPD